MTSLYAPRPGVWAACIQLLIKHLDAHFTLTSPIAGQRTSNGLKIVVIKADLFIPVYISERSICNKISCMLQNLQVVCFLVICYLAGGQQQEIIQVICVLQCNRLKTQGWQGLQASRLIAYCFESGSLNLHNSSSLADPVAELNEHNLCSTKILAS